MNWENISAEVLDALQEQLGKDWPRMKNAAVIFLQQRHSRLVKLYELYHSGSIDKKFLQLRLLEEEGLLRAEWNALAITTQASIRRATRAAFKVLSGAILKAIL
jgi:hypothetical protein